MSGYLEFLRGRDNNFKEKVKTSTNYDKFRESRFAQGARTSYAKEGILKPQTLGEIEYLIDMLKSKKGIVVDLAGEGRLNQRMLDFFSGAIYALGGNIHRIEKRIYIIMPKGVKLMNDGRVGSNEYKKDIKVQKAD